MSSFYDKERGKSTLGHPVPMADASKMSHGYMETPDKNVARIQNTAIL
jgi:hypothetical protein